MNSDLADRLMAHIDRAVEAAVSRRVEPLVARLAEVTRERDEAFRHLNGGPVARPEDVLRMCGACWHRWTTPEEECPQCGERGAGRMTA